MLNVTEGEKLVTLLNDLIEHPSIYQWDVDIHWHICDLLAVCSLNYFPLHVNLTVFTTAFWLFDLLARLGKSSCTPTTIETGCCTRLATSSTKHALRKVYNNSDFIFPSHHPTLGSDWPCFIFVIHCGHLCPSQITWTSDIFPHWICHSARWYFRSAVVHTRCRRCIPESLGWLTSQPCPSCGEWLAHHFMATRGQLYMTCLYCAYIIGCHKVC